MRKTGHILLFARIPRVDISLFISVLFLIPVSFSSVTGLLLSNATVHSVKHAANLAQSVRSGGILKAINTTIKIIGKSHKCNHLITVFAPFVYTETHSSQNIKPLRVCLMES